VTTIAWKAGVMACDSMWTHNGVQCTSMIKIRRLSSGALYGGAGDGDDRTLVALLDKVRSPDRLPSREDLFDVMGDFAAILAFPRGSTWVLEKDKKDAQIWEVNRGLWAIGSGGEMAIGSMASGKTAREAVAIVCGWDAQSKPPVHVLELRCKR
jgi:hypothetical protein